MVSFEKRLPQVVAIEKWACPTGIRFFFFHRDNGTVRYFARHGLDSIPMEEFLDDNLLFVPPEGAVFDRIELK